MDLIAFPLLIQAEAITATTQQGMISKFLTFI